MLITAIPAITRDSGDLVLLAVPRVECSFF